MHLSRCCQWWNCLACCLCGWSAAMLPIWESREDCGEGDWQSRASEGDRNYPSCTPWWWTPNFHWQACASRTWRWLLDHWCGSEILGHDVHRIQHHKRFGFSAGCCWDLGQGYGRQEFDARTISLCILTFPTCFGQTIVDGSIKTRSQALPKPHWKSASQTESRHGVCNSCIA